jgi:hypothetical protein
MNPETKTMSSFPAAADEIAWLQALHALELCQRVAELAARVRRPAYVTHGASATSANAG